MGLSLTTTIALIRQLAMRAVPTDLIFVDAAARDAFFASNPTRVESGLTVIINSNTTPILQLYQGATSDPYDNTEWQDITSVIQGPQGPKGDAGQLSATNLAYVSSSSNIPIGDQDGTFTSPYSTIQRAIDNLNASQDGIEVVDGSTYTEDITLAKNIRLFAPNANLVGNITTGAFTLSLDILDVTGTINNENNVSGFYTNNGRTTLSTGATEFDLVATLAKFTSNLEIDDTLFFGDAATNNNWRIRRDGNFLRLERLENGVWVSRGSFGSSLESDRFILENTAGTIVFENASSETRTLLKPSIDENGAVLGNPEGRGAILHNGELLGVGFESDTELVDNIQLLTDQTQTGTDFTYDFTTTRVEALISGQISLANVPANTIARVSLLTTAGVILAENETEFDFNNGQGIPVTNGLNTLSLREPIGFSDGFEFRIRLQLNNSSDIQGSNVDLSDGRGVRYVPRLVLNYYDGEQRDISVNPIVRTLIVDTTITASNYRGYRNNTILFNQDSATDRTLTITDGVFDDDNELTILFYPVADNNDGMVTIQMGATGTINGQNSITMLRDSSLRIKHTTGDSWFIVTDSESPITIRRDTPTIPQMRALLRTSLNQNSAFWMVANDQILANEQAIDNTIFIEALRDDLLDLNGNPIPTTATQKNITGVLLEAGTQCRIFNSTPTQSIIRVVFTPERSSSQSRIETETTSTTITSSNVAEYRNDLILFTNTSGIEDLIIQDDVFDVNDEITIKHYSASPGMSTGVDITQQGSGADIDGSTTIQLRGNTAIKIKYIGSNAWRVISSSGMGTSGGVPTTIVPDAHHFSINIPSRVTPNQAPDPVNGTRRVNFSVSNHDLITSMALHIGSDTFAMTVPTTDGDQFQDVSVNGIDISTIRNENMFIRLNNDSSLESNVQVLRIANPVVHERLYWDIQASGQANTFNYQSATAQSQEILGNENTFTVQTFTGNRYLAIAQPASETEFTDIFVNGFAQGGAFTKTDDAVQINSVNYDVWVSNNALVGSVVSGDSIRVVR